MKKYFFEVDKKQLEKPTEPLYVFCAPARVWAFGETEEEARAAALRKLEAKYHGTGTLLGRELRLTKTADVPVGWSYDGGTGSDEDKAALWQSCTK